MKYITAFLAAVLMIGCVRELPTEPEVDMDKFGQTYDECKFEDILKKVYCEDKKNAAVHGEDQELRAAEDSLIQ